jgi:LmbE family N-acetylglucosaminyl deacetylase
VYVAIATDGSAGSIDKNWNGDHSRLVEARAIELKQACKVLGVNLITLGYQDSGYVGDPANNDPAAFIKSDEKEVIGHIVRLIREIRPQVVITHDETGGYFHPDHIYCHKVTKAAFFAAGDPLKYPEFGLESYQPERLYYSAFSNRWVRIGIIMMRLKGQDPKRAGRNQDIDFTQIGVSPEKITTSIDYRRYWDVKRMASAEHGSQGGGTSFGRQFPIWIQKQLFGKESFILAYPPPPPGYREDDLFDSRLSQID